MTTPIRRRSRRGEPFSDTRAESYQELKDSGREKTVKRKVFELMPKPEHRNGMTPDQAADILGEPFLTVRPIFTRFKNKGVFRDTGKRLEGGWGKMQAVIALNV